jgi:phage tail-like protein
MSPLLQPALSFNFLVTMWDVQGPGFFGIDGSANGGWGVAASIASGLAQMASQVLVGAFSEVGGLAAEMDLESYQEGGANGSPRRFPKTGRFPNITLKRGVTFNTDLWDWHQQVLFGEAAVMRKSGMILLLERGSYATTGSDAGANLFVGLTRPPIAAWYFERALPERVIGPPLGATNNTVAVETLELAHEGVTRVSLSVIPGMADISSSVGGLVSAAAAVAYGAATQGALAGVESGRAGAIGGDAARHTPEVLAGEHPPAGGAEIAGDPPPPPPTPGGP